MITFMLVKIHTFHINLNKMSFSMSEIIEHEYTKLVMLAITISKITELNCNVLMTACQNIAH